MEWLNNLIIYIDLSEPKTDLVIFFGSLFISVLVLKLALKERAVTTEKITETKELEPVNIEIPVVETVIVEAAKKIEPVERPQQLSERIKGTRRGLFEKLKSVFGSGDKIDEDTLEELQALLISCDLGVNFTKGLLSELRNEANKEKLLTYDSLIISLKNRILQTLRSVETDSKLEEVKLPHTIMVVGVNGVGKTTSCAKLASRYKDEGKKVLLVAADTFRAAAVEQLKLWGDKIGVPVITGLENAKPATVVFDGMKAAKEQNADIVIIDTAGRLHNKSNLMQELEGVKNNISRHHEEAPHEVLLVIDGTTGQNALVQAQQFNEVTKLTGLVITKLDGTAKGGIVVAVADEIKVPVKYIGVGEGAKDLRPFNAEEFTSALFDTSETEPEKTSAHGETRRRRRAGND